MPEKTVLEKMYVKNALALAVLNDGGEHAALLAQLPQERRVPEGERADWLLLFARSRFELEAYLPQAQARLMPGGAVWVAYRKGGIKAGSDIDRDAIRDYAHSLGLDSVAMIAIDLEWSALRLKQV
ncbi:MULTISPECIES: DUF3052 domain-containing protein [unclassified Janthinobacterium]|uniref:DUF3052 domain-containing protein n=1 Tax=unclassified Janthinobacterium TaxID=2610881 RepID=UPI00160C3F8B|nr:MULTISPECIES: DUF3052 domain-containing protein [unclassified Janthinobacterium]MBB5367835.1 hypothetical protein [Janthinobacterium sp. K2C7]MBB5379687.1 hypothetical protein [Janthinobacterium sp. K2Li3]MBB5386217.1 hypothetical protein [Janthinobacterium sp. K2E3]